MTKRIATLMALVGMAGPAFAQMTTGGLEATTALEQGSRIGNSYEARAGWGDCEARYRSAKARNEMLPSQRRAALAICRATADARVWQQKLAQRGN